MLAISRRRDRRASKNLQEVISQKQTKILQCKGANIDGSY